MAPFEPEAGAYGGAGHEHGAAKIHDHHHAMGTGTIMTIATMITTTSLVRLLQLASPTLPVGAYSYSQGLEAAIEAGVVTMPRLPSSGSAIYSSSPCRAWKRPCSFA